MMKTNAMSIPYVKQGGIALLEALIAILVFSIGILGVVALQASMIQGASDARYRAEASYIAQQRIGKIWADGSAKMSDQSVDNETVAELPSGLLNVVRGCNSSLWCYTVTVSWVQPGTGTTHSVTTTAHITPTSSGITSE